jgi:hypothetical protein
VNLPLTLFIFGLTFHFTTDWEPHFLTSLGQFWDFWPKLQLEY